MGLREVDRGRERLTSCFHTQTSEKFTLMCAESHQNFLEKVTARAATNLCLHHPGKNWICTKYLFRLIKLCSCLSKTFAFTVMMIYLDVNEMDAPNLNTLNKCCPV